MVNLKALERSLAKIEAVGYDELDFEVDGIKVVLRPISPEEENEVERYSRSAYNEDEYATTADPLGLSPNEMADVAAAKNIGAEDGEASNEEQTEAIIRNRTWIDRLRQASLAFAIIEVDGLDLREVEYVDTGEQDDNGNDISEPKYEAVRRLISKWRRPVLTQMFAAYGEMVDRVNLKASRMIRFDPSDVAEEVKRLKTRLEELERHQKASEGNREDPSLLGVARTVNDAQVEANRLVSEQARREKEALQKEQTEPPPDPAAEAAAEELRRRKAAREEATPRDPHLPEDMDPVDQPPVSRTPRQPLSARAAPPPPEREEPEDPTQTVIEDPHGGDSFFDPSDGDAAYAAEMKRQEDLYRRQQARDQQAKAAREKAEAEGKTPIIQGRAKKPSPMATAGAKADDRTGLRSALNTGNAVFDANAGQVQRAQPSPKPVGKKGQTDIYRMPTTTLERRSEQPDPSKIQIDPSQSSRNPRFKPARDE